ncbi:hypothetical protein M5G07_09020 [Serratia symbiotica]|nr:hypothetical protein [Serratia symbiotica]
MIWLLCITLATCLGYAVVMLANVRNTGQKMVGALKSSAQGLGSAGSNATEQSYVMSVVPTYHRG